MYVTVIKFDFGIHTLTKKLNIFYLPSVQFSSVTHSCLTLCDPMAYSQASPSTLIPEICSNSCPPVSDAIQPSHPLSSPSPPAFNLSQHQGLCQVLNIRWPRYWSFSFSISPSKVYSGLISFRIDWLDLLAVQGTLRILLQHHSSKASIFQC